MFLGMNQLTETVAGTATKALAHHSFEDGAIRGGMEERQRGEGELAGGGSDRDSPSATMGTVYYRW